MKPAIVIIGIGEIGAVLARGFLKTGYPVYPIRREDDIHQIADEIELPALVILAVAEKDFDSSLEMVPEHWRDRMILIQNELLPGSWHKHKLSDPTVISVWFEKKPGQDFKVVIPSPIFGPHSQPLVEALSALKIPAQLLQSAAEMLFELVRKNLYILTTNICGLESGGTVKALWDEHSILMNRVFDDILSIQQALSGVSFNRDELLNKVLIAFEGDPEHQCMGRSAAQRLHRALEIAKQYDLEVPELTRIANELE